MPASQGQPYARDTVVASGARTVSGNGGLDANDWSGAARAVAFVVVTAVAGTSPTLTVNVEDSPDGSNFALVAASASITAAGTYRIPLPGPFSDRLRFSWLVGGTTPSFTFSVIVYSENAEQ